ARLALREADPVNLVSTAGPECQNPSSAPYSSATHQTELLTLRGGNWMSQSVRQPQLDERLSGYTQSARFPVQGIHHPSREIDVHSLRVGTNTLRPAEIELICDVVTSVKLAIKGL